MTSLVAIAADLLVAVLLVATIVSAATMSRRIAKLKGDEAAMRTTIGDLMLATASAERAITGLRSTLAEGDRTLAERLRTAERYAADLAAGIEAGETVLARIGQIVASTGTPQRPGRTQAPVDAVPAPAPEPSVAADAPREPEARRPVGERLGVAAAAARALTERALSRLDAKAAA